MKNMKNINDIINAVKEDMGSDLFEFHCGKQSSSDFVISNGSEFFLVCDNKWNGECYEAFTCDEYGCVNRGAPKVEISPVCFETEDEDFNYIGYTAGRHGEFYHESNGEIVRY